MQSKKYATLTTLSVLKDLTISRDKTSLGSFFPIIFTLTGRNSQKSLVPAIIIFGTTMLFILWQETRRNKEFISEDVEYEEILLETKKLYEVENVGFIIMQCYDGLDRPKRNTQNYRSTFLLIRIRIYTCFNSLLKTGTTRWCQFNKC